MNEERIKSFIDSFRLDENPIIATLEEYANLNGVPIIRQNVKDYIRMLLNIKKPQRILEIGTAIGYSTLVMHYTIPKAQIITIEDYEPRIKIAKDNFSKYVLKNVESLEGNFSNIDFENEDIKKYKYNNILLLYADAKDVLKELACFHFKFDFIFLDAAKGQYPIWLKDIIEIMDTDAVLLSDNVFKGGEIIESRFSIEKRDRCIHARMREFLFDITHNEQLESYIFDLGDGISVSVKKSNSY